MLTFNLTDLPARLCRRERFRDNGVEVLSRSGLHPTERALIAALPATPPAGAVLIVGNRTGVLGMLIAALQPRAAVTQYTLDQHHLRALERAFAARAGARPRALCAADLPPTPAPDWALLQATARDTPAELLLDQLEDLRAILTPTAQLLIAYDGKPDWLRKQCRQIFGAVRATPAAEGVTLFHVAGGGANGQVRRRDFSAAFEASLPGGAPLRFTTRPGVFAHRRADEGGLALAEVAARDLQPGARLLDLGCGCGLVGVLLARQASVADALALDANARAIACTRANAAANGVAALRAVLSDSGTDETGFTLAMANPPYFSDYKIADLFIATAHRALAPGGLAFFVAKNHRRLAERVAAVFGGGETIMRRGYGVIRAPRA